MIAYWRVCPLAVLLAGMAGALPAGHSRGIGSEAYRKPPLTFEWHEAGSHGAPVVARVSGRRLVFGASATVFGAAEPLLRFGGARRGVPRKR